MIISFIGPSGCGKGTQSKKFVQNNGYTSISTGEILREEYDKGSNIGKDLYLEYWKHGEWVPDSIISSLLFKDLDALNSDRVIIDAYPRTVMQASFLDEHLKENNKFLDFVFIFNLDKKIAIDRIISRQKDEKRLDASEDAILKRISNYYQNEVLIRDFYKKRIIDIDATLDVDTIYNMILNYIIK
ncbi:MAG: nucleoside monophosphate kinase [Patescibacteria group bacterium]